MADVFGDMVLVGILVVAASGLVEDLQGKVGSRRSDFSSRYIAVANINHGMVGIREVVQDDFAVFTKNGFEKVDKRYIARGRWGSCVASLNCECDKNRKFTNDFQ